MLIETPTSSGRFHLLGCPLDNPMRPRLTHAETRIRCVTGRRSWPNCNFIFDHCDAVHGAGNVSRSCFLVEAFGKARLHCGAAEGFKRGARGINQFVFNPAGFEHGRDASIVNIEADNFLAPADGAVDGRKPTVIRLKI